MRVLVLHSEYATGVSSGENRVVDDEVRLLREAGHDVTLWAPRAGDDNGPVRKLALGARTLWSATARRRLDALVEAHRPDVAHVHNLFPMLSPAVLRSRRVPVLLTLHNYRLLCLPATFMRDGRSCEDCFGRAPWPGVAHRCYRGSTFGSAALAGSLVAHRRLGTFDRPAGYLAVSEYVRRRHVEAGFDPERIWVKPNFAWPTEQRVGPGEDFLYVGRLSPEKGLDRLVAMWEHMPGRLRVIGDGPDRAALEAQAPPRVEFIGSVPHEQVAEWLRRARALVLPTVAYEGAPRTVVEAYAAGVPVVATRIGALPSVVDEGQTGLLAQLGDVGEWRGALTRLTDDEESLRMGRAALAAWEERYSPARALADLEMAYSQAARRPEGQPPQPLSHEMPSRRLTRAGSSRMSLGAGPGELDRTDRNDREAG